MIYKGRVIMKNLNGYSEKETLFYKQMESELKVLPSVIKKYYGFLRESNKTYTTIDSYLGNLLSILRTINNSYRIDENFPFDSIDYNIINSYFESQKHLSIGNIQLRWSVLNNFFNFLMSEEIISNNPMEHIPRPYIKNTKRKVSPLTKEELLKLFNTIQSTPTKYNAFRDGTFIKLALSTGLDVGEMINLNVEQINFIENHIEIPAKNKIKQIPMGSEIKLVLKEWIDFRDKYFEQLDTSALFVSTQKNRLSVDAVSHMLERYCEKANIKRITYKDLKSTMVYLLAKENVSMSAIMDFLDISDYTIIVQAYDEAAVEKDISLYEKLDGLIDCDFCAECDELNVQTTLFDSINIENKFTLQINPPEYSKYEGGESGFTIYANIINNDNDPLKLKLKSCSIFMNGRQRISNYSYSGYQFTEDYVFPNIVKTFGKIWTTDSESTKKLLSGDYLTISFEEIESKIEHHFKFIFQEKDNECYWIEDSHYKLNI